MKNNGVGDFIKKTHRTKEQLLNPESHKDKLRYEIAKRWLTGSKGKQIEILTLPSVWWNFEKLLTYLNKREELGVDIYFTGCEYDTDVYLLAADRLPRTLGRPLKQYYISSANIALTVSDIASLYNQNIFDYMKERPHMTIKFDYIWLDLMCVVHTMLDRLGSLSNVPKSGSEVVITYQMGRESKPIKGSREKMIRNKLEPLGFEYISLDTYKDGTPMGQVTFKRT